MARRMLIDTMFPEESRIAVMDAGVLQEFYIEETAEQPIVGNIYKAKVVHIESSLQAAFVEMGLERNGFLHISDVQSDINASRKGKEGGRRRNRTIKDVFHRGDEVAVQVTKEGVGKKGPAVTTYLSLAGRYLVLMPGLKRAGVSRKIEDVKARDRLRSILRELGVPKDMGIIARTAGLGRTKREISRDFNYLKRLWDTTGRRTHKASAPALIHQESDFVLRCLRDFLSADIDEVLVDSEETFRRARDFIKIVSPRMVSRIKPYKKAEPLFFAEGVERQLSDIHAREVALPKGGSIVLDQTEALIAIDVNSGSHRVPNDPERTALEVNLKAAKEVARQPRLRDAGGVIVIDFIDMLKEENRRAVEKELAAGFKNDRARTRIIRTSPLGVIEMTRQRVRTSLRSRMFEPCPHCNGDAVIRTVHGSAIDILRRICQLATGEDVKRVVVETSVDVAHYLNNRNRKILIGLEEGHGIDLAIESNRDFRVDQRRATVYNAAGKVVETKEF